MAKSTYKNLVTVPGASTDQIVGSPNTGIGGDIVANFKAIADMINPDGNASTGSLQALNVGCNFSYDSSTGKSYHILSNTGSYVPNGAVATPSDSNGNIMYGVSSGAFMKGVLINPQDQSTEFTLLNVPYAGGMLVEANVLAIDTDSNLHIEKGTLTVYPGGLTDTFGSSIYEIGEFKVVNGDLIFKLSSIYRSYFNAIQIGLHGTILAGYSYEINSDQSSATFLNFSSDSSS